jgi:hypothetical protein
MTALMLLLLAFLPIAVVLLLAQLGFSNGDRTTDAAVSCRLIRRAHPGGSAEHVEVGVVSRSARPSIVLARVKPATHFQAWSALDDRRSAILHRRHLAGFEILGAVEGEDTGTWLLPVLPSPSGALRVVVAVEQDVRRTRVLTFTLTLRHGTRPRSRSGSRTLGSGQSSSVFDIRATYPNDRR